MPPRLPRHGCGGVLRATGVNVARDSEAFLFTYYKVPGRRCSKCGTEIIERSVALALETLENTDVQLVHVVNTRRSGIVYTANTPTASIGLPSGTSGIPVNKSLVTEVA
jgi:hypothetical protein